MLAAVFLMQPFGQFLAYIIGYGALQHITEHRLLNWTADDWASADPRIQNRGTAAIVRFLPSGEILSSSNIESFPAKLGCPFLDCSVY